MSLYSRLFFWMPTFEIEGTRSADIMVFGHFKFIAHQW